MSQMSLRFQTRMGLDGWVRSLSSINIELCFSGRFRLGMQTNSCHFPTSSANTSCTRFATLKIVATCSRSPETEDCHSSSGIHLPVPQLLLTGQMLVSASFIQTSSLGRILPQVCTIKLSHSRGSLHAGSLRDLNRSAVLGGTNWRCRYDHLDKSGGYVINEAGDEPFVRQCWNRPECSNVDSHRLARIGD
jgi:hypothetical protein